MYSLKKSHLVFIIVVVYVMIIIATPREIEQATQYLTKEFKMKDLEN